MTFDEYRIKFSTKAYQYGYSEVYVSKCLNYAARLFDKNLPVIYDFEHFCRLVGYSSSYIKRAVNSPRSFYYDYNVPKKNGNGVRLISQPFPSLKEIQYWILNNILYKLEVSPYAKAYVPHRKFKDNLRFHKNKKFVITYDVANFFPSIKKEKIEAYFIELGYTELLSNLFSKLVTHRGYLPQGAPTSPYLSNLYMKQFDNKIVAYCKCRKIFYTRYADDLTFSSNEDVDINDLFNTIKIELSILNLELNQDKTHIMNSSSRQIVTGVVVNKRLQVPKEFRSEIRKECYYINKFGLSEHLARIKQTNEKYYIKGLLGRINYVLQIDPTNKEFKSYKKEMQRFVIRDINLDDYDVL